MPLFSRRAKNLIVKFAYEHLPMFPRRQLLFKVHQGYWPRLRAPQTFNEKVNWRVLFDHRPILAWTCDKLAMKDEARNRAVEVSVPSLLWSGENINEIQAIAFPERWILKPNHRSEFVYFGQGKPDMREIVEVTRGWLDEQNMSANGEWAYGQARRVIIAEEAIGPPEGPPADYKFFVFDGTVRLVHVEQGRFTQQRSRQFYWPDWTVAGGSNGMAKGVSIDKPVNLDEMLRIASKIASGFDFLRVDLYDVDGEVFFGEVSPYPASGHGQFDPPSLDKILGSYWQLPPHKYLRSVIVTGDEELRSSAPLKPKRTENGNSNDGLEPSRNESPVAARRQNSTSHPLGNTPTINQEAEAVVAAEGPLVNKSASRHSGDYLGL